MAWFLIIYLIGWVLFSLMILISEKRKNTGVDGGILLLISLLSWIGIVIAVAAIIDGLIEKWKEKRRNKKKFQE